MKKLVKIQRGMCIGEACGGAASISALNNKQLRDISAKEIQD